MNALATFGLAWQAVKDNRLRSTLTTLGVIIGIASVILLVTLGTSLQADLVGEVGGDDARLITVTASPEGPGAGAPFGMGTQAVFTVRDLGEIGRLDGVHAVIPRGVVAISSVRHGEHNVAHGELVATAAAAFDFEPVGQGRPFREGTAEAVLNPAAARLFAEEVRLDDVLTVRRASGEDVALTVVGLTEETDEGFGGGFPQRAVIYVPSDPFYGTTVRSPAGGEVTLVYPQVTVVAARVEEVDDVQNATRTYLEERSDARELMPVAHGFRLQTERQLIAQLQGVLGSLTGFVTAIAFISLVVGSIGIANIMLVSVTERTREIGIMRAIGGQRGTILGLFLTEAMILGAIGAVLGTAIGIAGGFAATSILDFPLSLPYAWIGFAILMGITVGLVAGLYPAYRAARLDPIEALRHE